MQVQVEAKQQDDAALLANNMAGITRELNQTYRRFMVMAISKDTLVSEIKRILNGHYDTTPVERILGELELRYELSDRLSRMLSDSNWVILNTNQLVLNQQNRIDIKETLRKYYHDHLKNDEPTFTIVRCGIFGFTEFLDKNYNLLEKKFSDERGRFQKLVGAFRLSLLHGCLPFAQKIWNICAPLGLQERLLTDDNFSSVAISKVSQDDQIKRFIQLSLDDLNLKNKVPSFTDDELFPYYARANNNNALLACWAKPRSSQEYLTLLTINNYYAFNCIADEYLFTTRESIVKCLITLNRLSEVVIPKDVWKEYFRIAVYNSPLSTVKLLWESVEDIELRKELLNHTIFSALGDFHIPQMRFLLEQAEAFPDNPIAQDNLEYIKRYAHEQLQHNLSRLAELLANCTLTKSIQLTI